MGTVNATKPMVYMLRLAGRGAKFSPDELRSRKEVENLCRLYSPTERHSTTVTFTTNIHQPQVLVYF